MNVLVVSYVPGSDLLSRLERQALSRLAVASDR